MKREREQGRLRAAGVREEIVHVQETVVVVEKP